MLAGPHYALAIQKQFILTTPTQENYQCRPRKAGTLYQLSEASSERAGEIPAVSAPFPLAITEPELDREKKIIADGSGYVAS